MTARINIMSITLSDNTRIKHDQRFKESLVCTMTPWKTVEKYEYFPDNFTFPAMCGSGVIFYGLDSTGFQSINCDLALKHVPSNGSTADDLYVFHEAMHSNHLQYDDLGKYQLTQMPLGYMSFSIMIDGVRIAPGLFINTAFDWERVIDLKTGVTTTAYTLPAGVRLTIEHVLLMGSSCPRFRLTAESTDNRSHVVDFRFELKLRTRYGSPIWDGSPEVQCQDDKCILLAAKIRRNGMYQPPEDYSLLWGLAVKDGVHHIDTAMREFTGFGHRPAVPGCGGSVNDGFAGKVTLTAQKRLCVEPGHSDQLESAIHFGSDVAGTDNAPEAASQLGGAIDRGFDHACGQSFEWWNDYFDKCASIHIDDVKMEYLFHRTLHLLTTGIAFRRGAPPSFQFVAGSPWWSNSSFHDSFYIIRGLIQANMKSHAQALLEWMRDYQYQKEERPIYWLTRYDGYPITRFMPEGEDKGYSAVTSLGLIPVLFTEAFGRDSLDRIGTYRMIRQILDYCTNHMIKPSDVRYVIDVSSATDVRSDSYKNEARHDAFLSLSMKPLYRKACEYAGYLNSDIEQVAEWEHIADNLYVPRDHEGNIMRNERGEKDGLFMTWSPVFQVSESDMRLPASQAELWKVSNARSWQAWGQFVASACGIAWHDGAYAFERLKYAVTEGSYGTGYISEVFLKGHRWWKSTNLANIPPFSTGHGSFLFAMVEHFVHGHIWNNVVQIGPLPGSDYYERGWRFRHFRSLNGALVTAAYDGNVIQGEITPSNNHAQTEARFIRPTLMLDKEVHAVIGDDVITFGPDEAICASVSGGEAVPFVIKLHDSIS